jgi:hypothetical protein
MEGFWRDQNTARAMFYPKQIYQRLVVRIISILVHFFFWATENRGEYLVG